LAAFRAAVMNHYSKLVDQFGSEDVIIFEGKRFGVRALAERALELVRLPYFRPYLRQKFEAATGIDCSGFYKDEQLQPLTAAAILEDFLASPEAAQYQEGVRYFFGHRIPD
jgi:hypothetical protein